MVDPTGTVTGAFVTGLVSVNVVLAGSFGVPPVKTGKYEGVAGRPLGVGVLVGAGVGAIGKLITLGCCAGKFIIGVPLDGSVRPLEAAGIKRVIPPPLPLSLDEPLSCA